MLRVHQPDLARRHTEKRRVEPRYVVDEACPSGHDLPGRVGIRVIEFVGIPSVLRHLGYRISAFGSTRQNSSASAAPGKRAAYPTIAKSGRTEAGCIRPSTDAMPLSSLASAGEDAIRGRPTSDAGLGQLRTRSEVVDWASPRLGVANSPRVLPPADAVGNLTCRPGCAGESSSRISMTRMRFRDASSAKNHRSVAGQPAVGSLPQQGPHCGPPRHRPWDRRVGPCGSAYVGNGGQADSARGYLVLATSGVGPKPSRSGEKLLRIGEITIGSLGDWTPTPGSLISWHPTAAAAGNGPTRAGQCCARQLHAGPTSP